LTVLAPAIAELAFVFGPEDYFALMMLSFTAVAVVMGRSMVRGFAALFFGLALGTIGIDTQTGQTRMVFGTLELLDGISFTVVLVSLFAIGETLYVASRHSAAPAAVNPLSGGSWMTRQDWKRSWKPWLRGSVIGFPIGALPAGGTEIPTFLSYALERRLTKHPEEFGQGAIEGVAGPEAANNSAATASLVPLLALGIPFTPIAALMISAMLVQGVQPGPLLITQKPEIFWGLIASVYIGNVMLLALNIPMIGVWVSLLRIPHYLFLPMLLVLSVIGAYSVRNSIFDVWVLLGAGVLGYIFNKLRFQLAPLVVGLILGPNIEKHFRETLFLSQGDLWAFVETPIAITCWVAVAAILLLGFVASRRSSVANAMSADSSL
jgi:putative tricarboxylic transport membrane protein